MDPLVIIGGGVAGVTCAKLFSIENPHHQVILVSASPVVKAITNLKTIGRSIDTFQLIEHNANLLKSSNVEVIVQKVIQLDSAQHKIQLEDKSWLKYKKLCICTGGKPRTIEIDDKASKYIKYLRDTQTINDFTSFLSGSKRILVAGNGGIAIEVVYAVENIEIIWAIRENSFGAVFFDAGAAKFFSEFLNDCGEKYTNISKRIGYSQSEGREPENEFGVALGPDWSRGLKLKGQSTKNVSLETNVTLVKVYSNLNSIPDENKDKLDLGNQETWNIYVELTNGKIFGCDMIIVAFGVIPNNDVFIANNNFKLAPDKGFLVDSEMRTSIEDIYAAGDVCTVDWERKQEHWFQLRLWTQARQMGYYASKCIQAHLDGTNPELYFNFDVFTHVTQFFGFQVILLGLFDGQKLCTNDYKILCRVVPRKEYIKVILQNGKMKGAILIGETDLEETFEHLIYSQKDLTLFGDHLLDEIVDIIDFFD